MYVYVYIYIYIYIHIYIIYYILLRPLRGDRRIRGGQPIETLRVEVRLELCIQTWIETWILTWFQTWIQIWIQTWIQLGEANFCKQRGGFIKKGMFFDVRVLQAFSCPRA